MPQVTPGNSGEEIFAQHRSARKRRKRRILITSIVLVVVILAAIIVGITMLRRTVNSQFGSDSSDSVLSAEVTTGSISTTVSGSGTLTAEDVESIEILSVLEVADYYVEEGDTVEVGDLIATITASSMSTALADVQASLDTLDAQIESASEDEVSSTVTTSVSGRVKLIHVEAGDDVVTAMYNYGALVVLSLDGYMAVDIETDTLAAGDEVTVVTSDETEYTGTVDKVVSGVATVLITDNGPLYGDEVTVDGTYTGTLYIHSELKITGYAGTVKAVKVSENKSVSAGASLLTLTDTSTSANYDTLLQQRATLEEQMEELVKIYKEGGILATSAGVIESLSSTSSSAGSMYGTTTSSSGSYTEIATVSPDVSMSITISVDESDILSLEVGQTAYVSIESLSDDTYEGTVTEVNTSASSGSGVTTYTATITIDKVENMLAGMSASVVITIEGVDNALLIPVDALHQTSSTAYVYTEYDESTGEYSGMVEVTIGLSNSSYVEITSGLEEGDVVYYTESGSSTSDFSSMMSGMGGISMGGDSSGGMTMDMGGSSGGTMSAGGNSAGGSMSMPGGF